MVELALVLPLFLIVIFGIILVGIAIFYQQQITNAAREGARYASIHSATAQDPLISTIHPAAPPTSYGACLATPSPCSGAHDGWKAMADSARHTLFGINATNVNFAACYSGYRASEGTGGYDARPPNIYPDGDYTADKFMPCAIDGSDPTTASNSISCAPNLPVVDQASDISEAPGRIVANTVTVFTCYEWRPPLGGVSLPVPCPGGWCSIEIIPSVITQRAVITEPMERQQ
jgi:hypothetical protein